MFSFKLTFVLAVLSACALAIPAPAPAASDFHKQNGEDAIALNNKFQGLSADSACTDGEDACINSQFAQCANGKFVLTQCAGGTICVALPLVNKPGTSVTCSTEADKDARIAATGATDANSDGNGGAPANAAPAPAPVNAAPAPSSDSSDTSDTPSGATGFALQNGKDAQALNAQFQGLSDSSSCTDGQVACIGDDFAQCANGQFVKTSCGATLRCAALPLVNKPGTSVTCVDTPQAIARIQATGAGSSLTGN